MSFDLVLFGGTGDLAWRKLMPALFQAFRHGKLPVAHGGGRILAVARDEPTLFPIHLPDSIRIHLAAMLLSKKTAPGPPRAETSLRSESILPFKEFRETMDRQYLTHLVGHTGRNIKEACRISGLSRSRLYELLKEYNIADPA